MRSKNILSIAAFIIAFAFSTAFAGLFVAKSEYQSVLTVPVVSYDKRQPTSCFKKRGRYTAEKIEVFLSQDISYGRERDRGLLSIDGDASPAFGSSSFAKFEAVISEYVDASSSIDESGLPQEVQIAWRAHMKAWRDYADFLNSMKDDATRANLGNGTAYHLENHFNEEINNTWYEVLRVSGTYGAEIN